jgi:hypothetical protein
MRKPIQLLTNAELADAIKYAFDCCVVPYSNGYSIRDSEGRTTMLAHLKELTTAQAERARMLMIDPPAEHGEG